MAESEEGCESLKRARNRIDAEVTKMLEQQLQGEQELEEQRGKKQRVITDEDMEASVQGGEKSSSSGGLKRAAGASDPEDRQDHKVRVLVDDEHCGNEQSGSFTDEQMDELFGPDWNTLTSMNPTVDEVEEIHGKKAAQAILELSKCERLMREDFNWPTIDELTDLCEPSSAWQKQQDMAHEYWDEVTGLPLDPKLVVKAEKDELDRFREMDVYGYALRSDAENDPEGICAD